MTTNYFKNCPVCESSNIAALVNYSNNYLAKCADCSFVFATKIPTVEELMAHYETYPRSNSISEITIKRYNELLDKLEPYRRTNNMLDVGCGDGFFLETAKKRNWNVYGTEFTDLAIKICSEKGINMQQGKLNPNNYLAGFFDVISSFEVIEHINNPRQEIKNFGIILRSGGLVYVTTPNFNSLSRYYLKNKWNVIEYPEHLSYYTKKTLRNLFAQNKFKLKEFESTGISLSRISRSLSNGAAADAPQVNQDEVLRSKTETQLSYKLAKKLINSLLTFFNLGDSLKGTFVKL